MDAALLDLIWRRARSICEYCQMPEAFDALPFHIDHIIARKHAGSSLADNLALACYSCNLSKGPNIAGIDPQTQTICRLYHPRQDIWDEHFAWNGPELVGLTAVGRTTIVVLEINQAGRKNHRTSLIAEGVFPTPTLK